MMDRTRDVAGVRFVSRSSWRRGSRPRGMATASPGTGIVVSSRLPVARGQ